MQELASTLHMSKKSIYKLYDNKEDLMIHLLENGFAMIHEKKEAIIASDLNTVDKLKKELIALPDRFTAINWAKLSGLAVKYPRAARRLNEELNRNWESDFHLMDQGVASGELKPFSKEIFKAMFTASLEAFMSSKEIENGLITYQEAMEEMINILIDGIAA
jgi:AcrR family transcriptional regulator